MKVCLGEDLVERELYVPKTNPMYTYYLNDPVYKKIAKKAPKKCITAKVPAWAKARGGLKNAKPGTFVVANISKYIWSKMDNIAPGYRFAITQKFWNLFESNIDSVTSVKDKSEFRRKLDDLYNEAVDLVCKEFSVTKDEIEMSGTKSMLLKEERERRRPYLRKIIENRLVPVE